MPDALTAELVDAQRVLAAITADAHLLAVVRQAADACVASLRAGGAILFAGNGGSAAQAQHFAAELVNRFEVDRDALRSVALSADTSVLTAIGNDSGYERVFARQVKALGRPGDVFVGLTTSGASPSVLRAFEEARRVGMVCVGFAGNRGGPMRELCTHLIEVPSARTPRIQEGHLLLGHLLCGLIERGCFESEPRG